MAILTRVNGSLKPVMNVDVDSYTNGAPDANLVSTGVTVNVMGPKMDFFTVTAAAAVTANEVAAAVQTVQQLSTIYMYEYTDAASDTLALAVYPSGAWTTAALDTAIGALGGGWAAAVTTATATFTN